MTGPFFAKSPVCQTGLELGDPAQHGGVLAAEPCRLPPGCRCVFGECRQDDPQPMQSIEDGAVGGVIRGGESAHGHRSDYRWPARARGVPIERSSAGAAAGEADGGWANEGSVIPAGCTRLRGSPRIATRNVATITAPMT